MKPEKLCYYQKKIFIMGVSLCSILYSNESFSEQFAQNNSTEMKITNEPDLTASSDFTQNDEFIVPMITQQQDAYRSKNITIIGIATIVNFGKSIWNLLLNAKIVTDIKTDLATALPEGAANWASITGWEFPSSKPYQFSWELLGFDAVKFRYSVRFTHGGNYNGKGKYLTNVTIVPTDIKVLIGYKFSAKVSILNVTNIGTPEDPVAALQMILQWSLDSPVQHYERSSTFYITGDGKLQTL